MRRRDCRNNVSSSDSFVCSWRKRESNQWAKTQPNSEKRALADFKMEKGFIAFLLDELRVEGDHYRAQAAAAAGADPDA
jgi:hypothetical protein